MTFSFMCPKKKREGESLQSFMRQGDVAVCCSPFLGAFAFIWYYSIQWLCMAL